MIHIMLSTKQKFTLTEDTWNRYRRTFSTNHSNRLTNWKRCQAPLIDE